MKILTAEQIRTIDRLSTEDFGIPSLLLMENAGMRVVEALAARVDDLDSSSTVILCGKGNNGGDGLVVARQLLQRGCLPSVFLFAGADAVKGDARINLDILTAIGHPPVPVESMEDWNRERLSLRHTDVLIDGLLGTGLSKPVEGFLGDVIASLNEDFPRSMIVSLDLPSGCSADTGNLLGPAVNADLTVTLSAAKFCLVFPPANQFAGEVVISEIGNPHELLDSEAHQTELLVEDSFPEAQFPREDETHKGDYGRVLVIAGSRGKAGAAAMAGRSALAAGAGLVTVAVPQSSLDVVAGYMPELMTEPLAETDGGALSGVDLDRIQELVQGKSVVALGPGIGTHHETSTLVVNHLSAIGRPVVLDADGLNAFLGRVELLHGGDAPLVVTPHPGEMALLVGCAVADVEKDRLDTARRFAAEQNVYVVLKGFRTVIACPDGKAFVNPTGNPGMATAGSGDVLTGMIAGILGQPHLGVFEERLCLAVFLHGLAGDIAAEKLSEESLVATDLIDFLPEAWGQLRGE